MRRLIALLLLLPLPAFALHIESSDYPTAPGDQPVSFVIQCGTSTPFTSTALVDTNGTNADGTPVIGGLYLYQDLSAVAGCGPAVSGTVYAKDALGQASPSSPFAIPAAPTAPAGVKIVL